PEHVSSRRGGSRLRVAPGRAHFGPAFGGRAALRARGERDRDAECPARGARRARAAGRLRRVHVGLREPRHAAQLRGSRHATLVATRAPVARVAGQVFNVGCGQSVSVNDLWDRIQELAGVPVLPKYAEGRPGEVRNSLASIAKARELVGYEPVVNFDEGLRQTVAYYRESRKARRRRRPRAVGRAA